MSHRARRVASSLTTAEADARSRLFDALRGRKCLDEIKSTSRTKSKKKPSLKKDTNATLSS